GERQSGDAGAACRGDRRIRTISGSSQERHGLDGAVRLRVAPRARATLRASNPSASSAPPPPDPGGAGAILTVTDCGALCTLVAEVQMIVKVVDTVSGPDDCVPEVASLPLQPPEAVQLAAFCDDQVRVTLPPDCTSLEFALRVTVGAGGVGATEIP